MRPGEERKTFTALKQTAVWTNFIDAYRR